MDTIDFFLANNIMTSKIPKDLLGAPLVPTKMKRLKEKRNKKDFQDYLLLSQIICKEKPEENDKKLRKGMEEIGNGIFKQIIAEGVGKKLEAGSKIVVIFTLIFQCSDKSFSLSSIWSKKPFSFILGTAEKEGILPGFELAVLSMRNQEKANFLVPHKLLYGENGLSPEVPPRQDGFLRVEVIQVSEVLPETQANVLHCSFSQAMARVEELRERGKEAFNTSFFKAASDFYMEAIALMQNCLVQSKAEHDKRLVTLVKLRVNAGMTHNKMEHPAIAYSLLVPILILESNNADLQIPDRIKGKLYLHAARAARMMRNFNEALSCIKKSRSVVGWNEQEPLEELDNIYQDFKKNMLHQIIQNDFGIKIIDECVGAGEEGMQDQEFFAQKSKKEISQSTRSAFEHTINAFICSPERNLSIYVYRDQEQLFQEVKKMASNLKIKAVLEKLDGGSVRFRFTK